MNVLINSTGKVSYNLQNNEDKEKVIAREEVVNLIKEKIEESIINDKSIVVILENSCLECRNNFYIEDYDIDQECFYLSGNNFELHIKSDNMSDIKYNNTYDEQFTITCEDSEITLIF